MKDDVTQIPIAETPPFHQRAVALKKRKGLAAKDVAKACGVSEATISRYFSGASVPPEDVAAKIMNFLRTQPDKVESEKIEEDDMQAAFNMIKNIYEGRISDLWKTISAAKRDKFALFGLVCALIVVLVYVLIDAGSAGWGWFQPR